MRVNIKTHSNQTKQVKTELWPLIEQEAKKLGLVASLVKPELTQANQRLKEWLKKGYHGEMSYMAKNQNLRKDISQLHPQTITVVSVRLNYFNTKAFANCQKVLSEPLKAYFSRYSLGRDYHKTLKSKLKKLCQNIEKLDAINCRVFTDSAPILEKEIAKQAGLGFIGKNTLLINPQEGSYFFLGEVFVPTDLGETNRKDNANETTTKESLTIKTEGEEGHCGSCTNCLDLCPTQAIVAPYTIDARRCISYLTIEYKGVIDESLRSLMGNRIFGCDDCQLVCPWNGFAKHSEEADFKPRYNLADINLLEVWQWSEEDFEKITEGMAIRRAGFTGLMRNVAIALGNALADLKVSDAQKKEIIKQLKTKRTQHPPLVQTHIDWALNQAKTLSLRIPTTPTQ